MKKFLVAIIAILYISTSTGAMLHLHYCMGELADYSFSNSNSNTCNKCGMSKSSKQKNACCKDENKFVKNTSDQKTADAGIQLMQQFLAIVPTNYVEITATNFVTIAEVFAISHAPPETNGLAVYIKNRRILI